MSWTLPLQNQNCRTRCIINLIDVDSCNIIFTMPLQQRLNLPFCITNGCDYRNSTLLQESSPTKIKVTSNSLTTSSAIFWKYHAMFLQALRINHFYRDMFKLANNFGTFRHSYLSNLFLNSCAFDHIQLMLRGISRWIIVYWQMKATMCLVIYWTTARENVTIWNVAARRLYENGYLEGAVWDDCIGSQNNEGTSSER